ncbi:hypothetical protein E1B28_007769 [Marasmius oreades]|uniref:Uncharacterized protein n=1 Tax=Marasmius oreades TaxID=181124 RepID=A0A9P7UU42_9AGAR|nr:uncharacterized protein E1B28_007769 [Marasmius oreades]KAG7094158.1 hypothetical protein E1B28_007769 [Marasmius oreades]
MSKTRLGVYVILFFVGIVILCRREGNNKAKMGLLLAITTMFVMASFCFWSNMAIFMAGIQDILVNDVGQPLASKHAVYAQKYKHLASVLTVIVPFEIVIGDTIVFWRTWALCVINRKLIYIPLLLLVGTTMCSFAFLGCYVLYDWPLINPGTCNSIQITAYSLSMATNIAGTIVIGYNFWCYRQAVARYLRKCEHQVRTEKIFVLLLESGVIYSILWIVQLVLGLVSPPPTLAGEVVQQIFTAASIQVYIRRC